MKSFAYLLVFQSLISLAGTETTRKKIEFNKCKEEVNKTIGDTKAPSKLMVESQLIYIKKAFTKDGEMLFTCSKPDERLTITVTK